MGATRRGLSHVDGLERVLACMAWFVADRRVEHLAAKIQEAILQRKDSFVVTIPASAALPAGKVAVFPSAADLNGGPCKHVVTLVASVAASWHELERRKSEA